MPQPSPRPQGACAGALLAALLLAAAPGRSPAQQKPAAKPPTPAAAAAPAGSAGPAGLAAGEEPAEKVFKNIKVLNGMPASQMLPVMHLMRSSLGVRCDFCHEVEGNRFELDTKRAEETAREMVRMVLALNKESFEGRTQVTCNTCHRGAEHPVRTPPIGQGWSEDTTGNHAEPPREKLPEPAEILDRYLRALGGREALEAVRGRTSRGTLLHAQIVDGGTPGAKIVNRGQEDPLEIVQSAPSKMSVTFGPPAAQTVQTLDGEAGRLKTPHGERALTAAEVARMAIQADLQKDLKLRADKSRVVGRDSIDGHDVLLLRTTLPNGDRATLAFDAGTGLLRRQLVERPTFLGPDPEQTDYDDYRQVGAVKVPFLVKTSYLDDNHQGITRKLTEVENDPAR